MNESVVDVHRDSEWVTVLRTPDGVGRFDSVVTAARP